MKELRKLSILVLMCLLSPYCVFMFILGTVARMPHLPIFGDIHLWFLGLGVAGIAAAAVIVAGELRSARRTAAGAAPTPQEDEWWTTVYWGTSLLPLSLGVCLLVFSLFIMCDAIGQSQREMSESLQRHGARLRAIEAQLPAGASVPAVKPAPAPSAKRRP